MLRLRLRLLRLLLAVLGEVRMVLERVLGRECGGRGVAAAVHVHVLLVLVLQLLLLVLQLLVLLLELLLLLLLPGRRERASGRVGQVIQGRLQLLLHVAMRLRLRLRLRLQS